MWILDDKKKSMISNGMFFNALESVWSERGSVDWQFRNLHTSFNPKPFDNVAVHVKLPQILHKNSIIIFLHYREAKKGARFASIDRSFTTNIRLIHVWISTLLRLKSTFEYQMSRKYRRPFWMFPFHSPVAEFKIRNLCYLLLFSIIVPIQTTHNDVSIDTEHLNFLCISVFLRKSVYSL